MLANTLKLNAFNPLWCVLLLIIVNTAANGQTSVTPYRITAMKVMSFSHSRGDFYEDVSNDKEQEFWNALDLSLFATVEVSGKVGWYSRNRRVEVTAHEGRKLILRRVAELGVLDGGKYYVPVWLYGVISAGYAHTMTANEIDTEIAKRCG